MLGDQPGEHRRPAAVQAAEEDQALLRHAALRPTAARRMTIVSASVAVFTAQWYRQVLLACAGRWGRIRAAMAVQQRLHSDLQPAVERQRTFGERVNMRFRSLTRNRRALPDFLIIGGQRCGSTSLYSMVCEHPLVMAARHKEPHFFDVNHRRGEAFYRRLFPLTAHMRARGRRAGGRVVTGEATTHYLSNPAVPARVAAMLPEVRLVATLRDPVDRAYSHYQLARRNGRELLSFEAALAAEDDRLAGEEERLLADPTYRGEVYSVQSYRTRGLYLRQLEWWWQHVREERLLVLRAEDMFADPVAVYRQVTAFLGLPPDLNAERFEARNRESYDDMPPETRAELRAFYAGPNRALEQRLGRAMGWQGTD
jgi:hypothetical protein